MSESKEIGVMITNMDKSWSDETIVSNVGQAFNVLGIPISVARYEHEVQDDPQGEIIEFVIRRTYKTPIQYKLDNQPAHEHLKETE